MTPKAVSAIGKSRAMSNRQSISCTRFGVALRSGLHAAEPRYFTAHQRVSAQCCPAMHLQLRWTTTAPLA